VPAYNRQTGKAVRQSKVTESNVKMMHLKLTLDTFSSVGRVNITQ
jgi:hypothetical protein